MSASNSLEWLLLCGSRRRLWFSVRFFQTLWLRRSTSTCHIAGSYAAFIAGMSKECRKPVPRVAS